MQPGFFGKLPAYGDFMCRGLSAPIRKSLDHWITRYIGQKPLPAGGLRARLTIGGAPYFLVIIASRDKRGRDFPIVTVAPDSGQKLPVVDDWCDLVAKVLGKAISEATNVDALVQALPDLTDETGGKPQGHDILWQRGQTPRPLVPALAAFNSD